MIKLSHVNKHVINTNRIKSLGIETLKIRWLKADLVMCYKIIHKKVDLDRDVFFRIKNRGNNGRMLSLDVPPAKYPLDCRNIYSQKEYFQFGVNSTNIQFCLQT